jgi:hypothetical protein
LLSVPLAAQTQPDWLSRFALHGYLSQAYADSDEFPIFGIPTDGTTDYRDLALQLRFDANAKNAFVVQIRQERFGESARQSDDVALDWAFYGYEFSERLAVKAGRIPLPLGIFNEASGAATTSPFFRPPYEFYTRQFSSKTVDGALVTASLGRAGGWSFDVDAYGGRWALDEWSDSASADAEDAWGAQVWANTPWPGVRLGAGAYRCSVQAPYTAPADYVMLHASVDADLDRWRLASEFLTGDLDRFGRYQAAYGQAGYQFTPRFSAHGRLSAGRMRIPVNGHHIEPTISRDLGLSLNYSPLPALLFKLEGHTNEGFLRQDAPPDYYGEPSETRYFIASVVASF